MDFSDRKRLNEAKAQAAAFIQHFPEAGLDPDATAETFMERQERTGGTRATTLKQLHRQITRYHTCTPDDLARAYIHAPNIGTEPADRTLERLKHAAGFFGLANLLRITLHEPEQYAWLLCEPISTFITQQDMLMRGRLKETGLEAEDYIKLLQAKPSLLRADKPTLFQSLTKFHTDHPQHSGNISAIVAYLDDNPVPVPKRAATIQKKVATHDLAHDLSEMLETISVHFSPDKIRGIYQKDPSLEKVSPTEILDHLVNLELTHVGLNFSIFNILKVACENPEILQRQVRELSSVTRFAEAYASTGFTVDDAVELIWQDTKLELLAQSADKTMAYTNALVDTLNQLGMGGEKQLTARDILVQPGLVFYAPQFVTDGNAAREELIKAGNLDPRTCTPHADICKKIKEQADDLDQIGIPPARYYSMLCLDPHILKLDSSQIKTGYDKLMTVHGPQGLSHDLFLRAAEENPNLLKHLAQSGSAIADKVSLLLPPLKDGKVSFPDTQSPYACLLSHKRVLSAQLDELALRVAWVERSRRRTAKPYSLDQYLSLATEVMAPDLNHAKTGQTAQTAADAILARFAEHARPQINNTPPRERIITLPELPELPPAPPLTTPQPAPKPRHVAPPLIGSKKKLSPNQLPSPITTIKASLDFAKLTGAFGGPAQIRMKPIDPASKQKSRKP